MFVFRTCCFVLAVLGAEILFFAVFDGYWTLFGSIFTKNVWFSLAFIRDSWWEFSSGSSGSTVSTVSEVRPGRIDPGFPRAGGQDDGSLPQTPSNKMFLLRLF